MAQSCRFKERNDIRGAPSPSASVGVEPKLAYSTSGGRTGLAGDGHREFVNDAAIVRLHHA